MGLVDDIERKSHEAAAPKRCKLGALLHTLSSDEKEAVEYALSMVEKETSRPQDERMFTITWLTNVLNNNGYSIGKTVVSDHLRKGCACEQPSE